MSALLSDPSAEWYAWREGIANIDRSFAMAPLVCLEQMMLRSKKETRCAECGGAAELIHTSGLIQSVEFYYLCSDCDRHFEGSVGGNKYTVVVPLGKFVKGACSLNNKREAARIARTLGGEVRCNESVVMREP